MLVFSILIFLAPTVAFGMRAAFAANARPLRTGRILWNLFGAWAAVGVNALFGATSLDFLHKMGCRAGKFLEGCDGFLAETLYLVVWTTAFSAPFGAIIALAFMPVTLIVYLTAR